MLRWDDFEKEIQPTLAGQSSEGRYEVFFDKVRDVFVERFLHALYLVIINMTNAAMTISTASSRSM